MAIYSNIIEDEILGEEFQGDIVKQKIIAFSGAARVGKDTFANTLIKQIRQTMPSLVCKRYSFAEGVREELKDFIIKHYKIDPWTEDPKEKEIIRPILIAHGNAKRTLSNNRYWINYLCNKLKTENSVDIAVISDLRFASAKYDESTWVKKNNGLHIHLRRYEEQDGIKKIIKPTISFEKQNEPKLLKAANKVLDVKTFDNEQEKKAEIESLCEEITMQLLVNNK